MADFEIAPVGTVAELRELEAELARQREVAQGLYEALLRPTLRERFVHWIAGVPAKEGV